MFSSLLTKINSTKINSDKINYQKKENRGRKRKIVSDEKHCDKEKKKVKKEKKDQREEKGEKGKEEGEENAGKMKLDCMHKETKNKTETNNDHDIEFSKYMLKYLLPYLRELDLEQMAEKEIEAKIQDSGSHTDELKIDVADCSKDQCACCDNCQSLIFDYHRSCTKCSFDLCLRCCAELRRGELLGGADPVEFEVINQGQDYLHGGNEEITITLEIESHAATKPEIQEWSKSGWHAGSDGSIRCPKPNNECDHGLLELRRMFPPNCISEVVCKAEQLKQTVELEDKEETLDNGCSCFKPVKKEDDIPNDREKVAFREDSPENFLYCPRAIDLQNHEKDLRHFQWHWRKGEPVIVSNVIESSTSSISWEPLVMWHAFHQLNDTNHNSVSDGNINVNDFFSGYTNGRKDKLDWPQLLKLKDYPPNLFEKSLPRHCTELISSLPFKEYTDPFKAALNLALKLPDNVQMGLTTYFAYGFSEELGRGDSVTKLHCDMSDVVNVLTHIAKWNWKLRDGETNVDGLDNLSSPMTASDEQNSVRVMENESGLCDAKVVDSVHHENSLDGALWDIFRREDVPKLKEYLMKHFREFRHIYCSPLKQVFHPIHDQSFYFTNSHKKRLKEEYGIEPWSFVQKLGAAVFIPAGCPHQVRNLKSCTKVALDFVSPENAGECLRLTEEIRKLPVNHCSTADNLEFQNPGLTYQNNCLIGSFQYTTPIVGTVMLHLS
ncbi:transcription factor jumonji (jmjC) domain protein [Medicago truncatula]|uniref:Transcription factor jumonji (JmjC) domain protein n=1 Tax=Medicago truncatula TaxID=3880 RepID=A0A072TV18_MEDTR|nr:transcription factor jumonji (jmjC) domain protein [Medicago truncatula]